MRKSTDLASLILALVGNPKAMDLYRELERCRSHADAVGMLETYDKLFLYEQKKHEELPYPMPMPKQILQAMLATFS